MNLETSLPLPADEPGAARCPGPSTRDIIIADGQDVPPALIAEAYAFAGDADIDYDRYTSPDFMAREFTHLWARTWQWAAREEHIPDAGDYITYDIGPWSILIVRGDDMEIRAYRNACLHRGTQLKRSDTSGNAVELRCPFHGWRWSLEGELSHLPCRWDFPHVKDEEFSLPQVRMETWGGFVFINLDPDARPLKEQLGPLAEHFSGRWDLADRRIALHLQKELPTNWKAAQEAFLEAYHVYETHSQALPTAGDANAQYDIFSDHVTRFVHVIGKPSPHFTGEQTEQELFDKLRVGGGTLPEGRTARSYAAEMLRKQMSADLGVALDQYSDSEMLDAFTYNIFPNLSPWGGFVPNIVYRWRPWPDQNATLMEVRLLGRKPKDGAMPEAAEMRFLTPEEPWATVTEWGALGEVFDQDMENLPYVQEGLIASANNRVELGRYQEGRIRQFHQTMDKYLAGQLP